ncbi:MAG: NAD(P)H-binding protein, partial [Chlamydiia bacterium]|nr:NAD(P)H-binding protein [Chlamydiia bacterium]
MRHTLILGCGYIGSALAASWKQREFELTLTTTSPSRVAELGPLADRVLLLDATQKASTVQALANVDTLIVTLAPSKPGSSYRAIYLDTARAIAQAVHAGAPIKQIVYTGSASVYNDNDGAWVTEDHPLAPKEERQAVLIEAERCLLELAKGSRHVCVLRLGEIYGPERDPAQRL